MVDITRVRDLNALIDEAAARIVEVLRAAFLPHPALLADTFGLFPSAADAVDLDDWPEWTED